MTQDAAVALCIALTMSVMFNIMGIIIWIIEKGGRGNSRLFMSKADKEWLEIMSDSMKLFGFKRKSDGYMDVWEIGPLRIQKPSQYSSSKRLYIRTESMDSFHKLGIKASDKVRSIIDSAARLRAREEMIERFDMTSLNS